MVAQEKMQIINGIHMRLDRKARVRIYQGDGNPIEVVFGVMNGIDLFESW